MLLFKPPISPPSLLIPPLSQILIHLFQNRVTLLPQTLLILLLINIKAMTPIHHLLPRKLIVIILLINLLDSLPRE